MPKASQPPTTLNAFNQCVKTETVLPTRDRARLAESVLYKIKNSGLDEFKNALAWAQWCRQMANAALTNDWDAAAELGEKP